MDKEYRTYAYLSGSAAVILWLLLSITLDQIFTTRTISPVLVIIVIVVGVAALIMTMTFINAVLAHREVLNKRLINVLTGHKADADKTTPPPPESGP